MAAVLPLPGYGLCAADAAVSPNGSLFALRPNWPIPSELKIDNDSRDDNDPEYKHIDYLS